MTKLFERPARVYVALVIASVLGVALSFASGEKPKDGSPQPHNFGYIVGGIGWMLFLLAVLLLLAFTVALVVRRVRSR